MGSQEEILDLLWAVRPCDVLPTVSMDGSHGWKPWKLPGGTGDQVGWGPEHLMERVAALSTAGSWTGMLCKVPSDLSHSKTL